MDDVEYKMFVDVNEQEMCGIMAFMESHNITRLVRRIGDKKDRVVMDLTFDELKV